MYIHVCVCTCVCVDVCVVSSPRGNFLISSSAYHSRTHRVRETSRSRLSVYGKTPVKSDVSTRET